MKNLQKLTCIALCAFSLSAFNQAKAQVLTDWTFGGSTPFSASFGTGTASSVGMTTNYGSGSTDDSGSLTSTLAPDTTKVLRIVGANGWNSSAPLAAQGVQFVTSTFGYTNVTLSFDIDITNQGSANLVVQYTTNGSSWTDVPYADYTSTGTASALLGTGALTLKNNTNPLDTNTVSGAYLSGVGDSVANTDTWFQGISVNLSTVSGVSNDANFGIRIVNASKGADDLALAGTALNNTSGNWRFDNVYIYAVPEPGSYALTLVMLGVLAPLVAIHKIRRRNFEV